MNRKKTGGLKGDLPTENEATRRFRKTLATEGVSLRAIDAFRQIILSFYRASGRDLPWRHTTDAYHILVSEIMLQQTQVERVVRKFPEFIGAFPTPHDLSSAPLPRVLAVWQGMGYNRRAISLQRCARKLVAEFSGNVPDDPEVLATFPGIGAATAGSIVAFAFDQPSVFIETNIRRVFIHFFFAGRQGIPDSEIRPLVKATLDLTSPRIWYSALMDYGTALKTSVPNPNRQSAHYVRQPGFEGSDRQLRGMIVRSVLKDMEITTDRLVESTARDRGRILRIVHDLEREGFLVRDGETIGLCDH